MGSKNNCAGLKLRYKFLSEEKIKQKKHFVDIKRYQFKAIKDNVGCENVVKTSLVDNIVAENICHTIIKIVHYPNKLPLDKQSSILTNVDKEYELLYLEKQNAKLCKRINQTAELIDAVPIQPLETVDDIQSDVSRIFRNEIKRVNAAATQEKRNEFQASTFYEKTFKVYDDKCKNDDIYKSDVMPLFSSTLNNEYSSITNTNAQKNSCI